MFRLGVRKPYRRIKGNKKSRENEKNFPECGVSGGNPGAGGRFGDAKNAGGSLKSCQIKRQGLAGFESCGCKTGAKQGGKTTEEPIATEGLTPGGAGFQPAGAGEAAGRS